MKGSEFVNQSTFGRNWHSRERVIMVEGGREARREARAGKGGGGGEVGVEDRFERAGRVSRAWRASWRA